MSLLHAEVVENLALLMSKEEEAFQPFLSACLGEVWNLLMATGLHAHQARAPRDESRIFRSGAR